MSFLPRRLGVRLNLFLVVLLAGLGVVATIIILGGFQKSEDNASRASREGIEAFGADTIGVFARLASESADISLIPLEQMTRTAASFLLEANPANVTPELVQSESGAWYDPNPERRSDLWLPASVPSGDMVAKDVVRSAVLDVLLPRELSEHPDVQSTYFMAVSGLTRYYPPVGLHERVDPFQMVLNERVYEAAGPDANPDRDTVWTAPYEDPAGDGLLISVATPIYDGEAFVGVIGVDIALEEFVAGVDLIRPSRNGYAFVIDSNGVLLPSGAQPIVEAALRDPGSSAAVGRVVAAMRAGQSGTERLVIGGEDVVVGYAPLGAIGGSLGLVAPVEDIAEQAGVEAVTGTIAQDGRQTLMVVGLAMLCLFGIAILGSTYMNRRYLIRPIDQLVAGTQAVAAGHLRTSIPVARRDELGELATAFNDMTRRLAAREDELRQQTAKREQAQQELQAVFAAMSDVVVVLARDGTYLRVSPARSELLQGTPEELIGRNVRDFYAPEQAEVMVEAIHRALDDGATQTLEYQHQGKWFLGAVSPMANDHAVWVARDITERIEARTLLEHAVEERTRELSTLIKVSHSTAANIQIEPLLDVLLEQLRQVVEFDGAAVVELENDRLVVLDSLGPDRREHEVIGTSMPAARFGLIWETLRKGQPVIITDMHSDSPEARAFHAAISPPLHDVVSGYIRSWMAVPMQTRDHIVGVLSVSRSETDYFDARHVELVSAFASFAAIAIDNARLFNKAQQTIRQNTALARMASTLQFDDSPDANLDALAKDVVEASRAFGCSLVLTTPQPPFFGRAGQYGLPDGYLEGMRIVWENGHMLRGPDDMSSGKPVVIPRGRTLMLADEGFAPIHSLLQDAPFEDIVVAPITVNGALGGAINFYFPRRYRPDLDDVSFVQAAAAQVSIVTSNAALFRQSERRTKELEVILAAADRLSSTLEIDPLIEIALDQISLIGPHHGEGVYLLDGDVVRFFQRRGDNLSGAPEQITLPIESSGPIAARVMRGESLLIDDVKGPGTLAEDYRESARLLAMEPVIDYARSYLCVPLMVSGRVIGAMGLVSNEPGSFDIRHRRLAQGVAYQMAVAFENARLFSETLKRERENRALAIVASALALDQPLGATLDAISRGVVETTDAIACSVALQDSDGTYVMGGGFGLPTGFPEAIVESVNERGAPSAALAVFHTLRPRVLKDVRRLTLEDPLYEPVHGMLKDGEWENCAIFPLMYGGRAIGNLSCFFPAGVVPDADAMALFGSIASQAALAVENARLFAETVKRERENRALASVASALSLDRPVETTFKAIAQRVVDSTEAVACGVTLLDERGSFILGGDVGLPEGFARAMVASISSGAPSAPNVVARTGQPEIHTKLRDYFRNNPRFAPVAEILGDPEWDNAVLVPLIYRGRTIGALSTFYRPDFIPGDNELNLLSALASQAAFAVENARLFSEMGERAREMEALYRSDEELYRSLDLNHVFQALCDVAVEVLGCDTSILFRWDALNGRLDVATHQGFDNDISSMGGELRIGGTVEHAIRTGEVVCVEDAAAGTGVNRHIARREGVASYMHVPITIDGSVFGIYNVGYRRPHRFTPEEQRIGTALSQRAAIAIQNARLYEQAQQAASLEERQRIARDLHDSVSQALYGIGLGARTAKTLMERDPKLVEQPLDYILSLSEAGLAELRALIFELRPDSLATDGLVAALERQVAATRARHQLEVEAELIPEPDVPIEVKEAIYRVAQEAITNAIKHAKASEMHVRLRVIDGLLELVVRDNGVGFDPDGEFPGHMGLRSMQERAQRLGGNLRIESAPGKGTRVCIALPCSTCADD